MGGVESSPPSAFTLKTQKRVPPPLPGSPDGSGISPAPGTRGSRGPPALCRTRGPAGLSLPAPARRGDVQNPPPERSQVPARLREGTPAASEPGRSAGPVWDPSARRKAPGDEAQDPGGSVRPKEPRRDARCSRTTTVPARCCRPCPLRTGRSEGFSDRPARVRVRVRVRGGGRSSGTYPRPGAESPAPAAHPRNAWRPWEQRRWRLCEPAAAPSSQPAPSPPPLWSCSPRSFPRARLPPDGVGPAEDTWHRRPPGPRRAPGTVARRAPDRRDGPHPRPGADCPGGIGGHKQTVLSSGRAEPHRRRARPYLLLPARSGTVGTRHVSNLNAQGKQTAIFSLLKWASCSDKRNERETEPKRCQPGGPRLRKEGRIAREPPPRSGDRRWELRSSGALGTWPPVPAAGPGQGEAAAETRTPDPASRDVDIVFPPAKFPQGKRSLFFAAGTAGGVGGVRREVGGYSAASELLFPSWGNYSFMSKPSSSLINTNLHKTPFPFE